MGCGRARSRDEGRRGPPEGQGARRAFRGPLRWACPRDTTPPESAIHAECRPVSPPRGGRGGCRARRRLEPQAAAAGGEPLPRRHSRADAGGADAGGSPGGRDDPAGAGRALSEDGRQPGAARSFRPPLVPRRRHGARAGAARRQGAVVPQPLDRLAPGGGGARPGGGAGAAARAQRHRQHQRRRHRRPRLRPGGGGQLPRRAGRDAGRAALQPVRRHARRLVQRAPAPRPAHRRAPRDRLRRQHLGQRAPRRGVRGRPGGARRGDRGGAWPVHPRLRADRALRRGAGPAGDLLHAGSARPASGSRSAGTRRTAPASACWRARATPPASSGATSSRASCSTWPTPTTTRTAGWCST